MDTLDTIEHSPLQIFGDLDEAILTREIEIAFGRNKSDKFWRNQKGTVRDLINADLAEFAIGPKDGRALLQGSLARDGERKKTLVRANYILMLDHDTGLPIDEVHAQIVEKGLFAVVWNTHSHLKTLSTIPQSKLTKFMGEIGTTQINAEVCRAYFRSRKVDERVVETMEFVKTDYDDNALAAFVSHAPMHRCRSLYILDKPFFFAERGGTQKDALEEWSGGYGGVSTMLGLPFDSSCADASRLMFPPRRAADSYAAKFEIRVIAGSTLDFDAVPRSLTAVPRNRTVALTTGLNAFQRVGMVSDSRRPALQTPGLLEFVTKHGHDFQALDFMRSVAPDDERGGGPENGSNFACPNEDGHTVQDVRDTAFFVTNGDGDKGFAMFCHHDSCKTASGDDRAWYLDKFCQNHEIEDASRLREFSASARVEAQAQADAARKAHEEADAARKAAGEQARSLDERISALKRESTPEEVEAILRELAAMPDTAGVAVAALMVRIAHATGQRREDLDKTLRAYQRVHAGAAKAAEKAKTADGEIRAQPPPANLGEAAIIEMSWPSSVRNRAALARLEYLNKQGEPEIFRNVGGQCVAISNTKMGPEIKTLNDNIWLNLMTTKLTLRERSALTGRAKLVDPPKAMRQFVQGALNPDFPTLQGIATVPVFGPDGTLRTEKGYDPELEMLLVPDLDYFDLPEKPGDDDVSAALGLIAEAVRDFPFTDCFDGDDPHPIRQRDANGDVVLDPEGYPEPNPERGRASFANFLAFVLQPFVRPIIGRNPCPFYHIDKASPGTGAGYLVDVSHLILTGARAPISVWPKNEEEQEKTVTAQLLSGRPVVFFDNVNHKVDNGALAASGTAGVWAARILGRSGTTNVLITQEIVFAGNELSFSPELMRRNVPIRLDANCPNPAKDRDPKDFKHNPLHDWVLANRRELVWACHTIVQSWIAAGMPNGSAKMASFDKWASTMSGILENCGVPGFLANVPDYCAERDDDTATGADFVQAMFDVHGQHRVTATELLDLVVGHSGEIKYGFDIDPTHKPGPQARELSTHLKTYTKKTFHVSASPLPPEVRAFGGRRAGGDDGDDGVTMKTAPSSPQFLAVKLIQKKVKGERFWALSSVPGV